MSTGGAPNRPEDQNSLAAQAEEVADQFEGHMPGRSLTAGGAALIGLAMGLSFLPGFYGPGLFWSLLAAALGVGAVQQTLRKPGVTLPPMLEHPLAGPIFGMVALVLTWSILSLKVIPMLWAAGTVCVGYDQYRKAVAGPQGLSNRFDLRLLRAGYPRLLALGLGVLLLALLLKFDRGVAGGYVGGYDYNYGGTYTFNYLKYYYPDISPTSGRAMIGGTLVQFVMVGMLLLSVWKAGPERQVWQRQVPLAGAVLLVLWWLAKPKGGPGSFVFLLGLIPVCTAAWFIFDSKQSGKWDGSLLLDRIPWPPAAWFK